MMLIMMMMMAVEVVEVVDVVLKHQSMPISNASSKFFDDVGMMPWLPTPTGMWSNTA